MAYNPALFTATNKPIGLRGTPVDARSYYYDGVNFVFRAYVDTAEVLAYLIGTDRVGQFSAIVNTGGTLVNGVITGGTNAEWWFKDGILDGDLVAKGSGGGGDLLAANNLSNVASMDSSRQNLGFQTIWNRKGVSLSPSISADQNNVGEANVIYDTNPQILTTATNVFKMVFTGGYSSPNIYYAESLDGVSWVRYASAIITNHDRPFFFKNGSTYYVYCANIANTQLDQYTSTGAPGGFTLAHAAVVTASGLGISAVYSPCIFIEGGVWKMMLECNNSNEVVFYLTSADGVTWVQGAANPVVSLFTAGNPQVFKIGSTYYMYGHGTGVFGGAVPTDVYLQSSPDLITWSAATLVFQRRQADEGPSFPNAQVGDVTMLQVDNSVYMWYVATKDGTVPGSVIKLTVANMTIDQLVLTTEGDGGDIIVQPPNFTVNPTNNNLTYNGGNYSTFAVNAPLYPDLILESNSAQIGTLGSGQSSHLTGATDLSLIANGSGNMSVEATNLYLIGNVFLPQLASLGDPTTNSYGQYHFNGVNGHFYWLFAYKGATAQQVYLTDSGTLFTTPQNTNDFLIATTANVVISTNSANDQVDAYAEFNPTSKSLILNGGNAAGFTDDANLILNVQSTTKGAAFPRMTTTQRLALTTTEGEIVYDLTLHKLYCYDGTTWQACW